jgi:hypothetical protein
MRMMLDLSRTADEQNTANLPPCFLTFIDTEIINGMIAHRLFFVRSAQGACRAVLYGYETRCNNEALIERLGVNPNFRCWGCLTHAFWLVTVNAVSLFFDENALPFT